MHSICTEFTREILACSLKTTSKNIIGKIGEDLPRSEFTDIQNLNDIKHNFPIFDIIGKKDGEVYVFSVKARKKYGENLKLNPNYNILSGKDGAISRKYKKALDNLTQMGYDINLIHYCFLIAPLEENKECVYYWGKFTDINPNCNTENILNNNIKHLGIPVLDRYLKTYKIYGVHDWITIRDKYISSRPYLDP